MEKEVLTRINDVFLKAFGKTPLVERLADIHREATEAGRFGTLENLKEETGDLIASALQLCNECDWNPNDLVENTLKKIERRDEQYRVLGRKVNVAILGGAFNPVTLGHVQVAKHVLNEAGEFDEVWLMPCYVHLYGKPLENAAHRLEMCRLAAAADGRIKVSDYEIKRNLSGETYCMIKRLKEESFADRYNFSLIIGQDNANSFDKWFNFKYLENSARFVVVPRKGIDFNPEVQWYLKPPHIYMKPSSTVMEVSSTLVRKLLYDGQKVEEFVNPDVLKYIKDNNLYQGDGKWQ